MTAGARTEPCLRRYWYITRPSQSSHFVVVPGDPLRRTRTQAQDAVEQHRKGKKAKRNDRIFAVPRGSHAEKDLSDVRDLTSAKREELEKFFIATDELEDKQLKILGWKGPKAALKTIKKGADAFQNK
jgi:Inorganic pyrophosphatase